LCVLRTLRRIGETMWASATRLDDFQVVLLSQWAVPKGEGVFVKMKNAFNGQAVLVTNCILECRCVEKSGCEALVGYRKGNAAYNTF
jgi:hypothetical protein